LLFETFIIGLPITQEIAAFTTCLYKGLVGKGRPIWLVISTSLTTMGDFKVTGSHEHCRSGRHNISGTVQNRDVTTGH